MSKFLKVVCMVLCVLSISESAFAAAGDWSFSGTNWIRMRVVQQDHQGATNTTDTTETANSVDRGYIRYAYNYTDLIKGQVTLDFASAKQSDFKDGTYVRLKEVYVDLPFPIADSKITAGLQKNYVGLIYDYDYRIIEKEFIDKNGLDASADYGLTLNGYFPEGYGTYVVGAYNGEGYKKAINPDVNAQLAGVLDVRFIPVPGVTIGGSYKTNKMGTNTTLQDNTLSVGMARLAYGKFDLWAEFINNNVKNIGVTNQTTTKKTGYSIMPSYQIDPKWAIVARYDLFDPNTDVSNDKVTTLIGGVNYTIENGLILQLNYQQDKPENSANVTTTKYLAQISWSFSRLFPAQ
jgi:hypothetical protein